MTVSELIEKTKGNRIEFDKEFLTALNPLDGKETPLCKYELRENPKSVAEFGSWEVVKENPTRQELYSL